MSVVPRRPHDRLAQIEAALPPDAIAEKNLAPRWQLGGLRRRWRHEVLRVLFERIDVAHTTKANKPRADLRRVSVKWADDAGRSASPPFAAQPVDDSPPRLGSTGGSSNA
jgi:hypothetical protein